MNILNIRSDFKLAGPGIVTFEFSKELKRRGHNMIFCSSGGALVREIKSYGMKHFEIAELAVSNRSIAKMFGAILDIRKLLINEDIDIIHGHNAISTFLAFIAAKTIKKKIKIVNTVHGVGKELFLKFMPFKLIAVSNDAKKHLISKGVSEKKISVIYNGIIDPEVFDINKFDDKPIRKEFNIGEDELLVGSVAMMTGGKGHDDIISSIPQILSQFSNVKFIFVGDGVKSNYYKEEILAMNLEEKVIFTGARRDIPKIMASIDVFAHMSRQETFGMVLIEAMAMKKPVVTRGIGGIPEIVIDGITGFLVGNVEMFSERVVELLNNNNLRKDMGERGYQRVNDNFVITNTIDNLLELYSKLT